MTEKNFELLDLMTTVIKVMVVALILVLIWLWWDGREGGLTSEEKRMIRLTASQNKAIRDEIDTREQKLIDKVERCHLIGQWRSNRQGDDYIIDINSDGTFAYKFEKRKSSHKVPMFSAGSGKWRWIRGQFIWLPPQINNPDNNPLLNPYFKNDILTDFQLMEEDARKTMFHRIAGQGECT